jgi:hypothetical protein
VPGLIAVQKERRQLLSDLCTELAIFKKGGRTRSRSFYIGDRPGFGKSMMVKKLADEYGFEYIPIDMSEVHKAEDMTQYYDHIIAQHQKMPDRPILVFVDEVNARVQGHNVYSWFLRPLEASQFHSRGETFFLPNCVWVFAGTADLRQDAHPRLADQTGLRKRSKQLTAASEPPLKMSDFVSRLNKEPYWLGDSTSGESALDRVYVGALSVLRRFGDVKFVSEKVLRAFSDLGDECSLREIRNYVEDFGGVVGAKVTWSNVGQRLVERLGRERASKPDSVAGREADQKLVQIIMSATEAQAYWPH